MKTFVCLMLVSLTLATAQDHPIPVVPKDPSFEPWMPLKPAAAYTDTLQRFTNGLAESAGKPQPNLSPCFDSATGFKTIRMLEEIFTHVASKDLAGIPFIVHDYEDHTPQVRECLTGNAEFEGILEGLGVKEVPMHKIYLKFTEYSLKGNYDQLASRAREIHDKFREGRLEESGKLSGELLKTVMNYNPSDLVSLRMIAKTASFLEQVLKEKKASLRF